MSLGFVTELIKVAGALAPTAVTFIQQREAEKQEKRELRRQQNQPAAPEPAPSAPQLPVVQGGLQSGLPGWFVPAAVVVVLATGVIIYRLRK